MIKIRRKIFETNSSSTHSFCIAEGDTLDCIQTKIRFAVGQFGLERESYRTPEDKASYLYTMIFQVGATNLIENIKSILDDNGIEYEFEEPALDDDGRLEHGHIDHQSVSDEFTDICLNEEQLMKYLFSSGSIVNTGNDNGWRWW